MGRRAILVTVIGASILMACGGDGGVDPEADQEAAEDAIAAFEDDLEDRDFEAQPEDDDDDDLDFESEECEEFDEAFGGDDEFLPGATANAESSQLGRGELDREGDAVETAAASVGFVEDSESAAESFDLLTGGQLGPCLEEAFRVSFADDDEGLTIGEIDLDTDDLGVGDESQSVQVSTTIGANGITLPFTFQIAVARTGRTMALVVLSVVGVDDIDEDADDLLEILLEEAGGN